MSYRPIGVFDSGLGGLSAVKELMSFLPNESIVYFGDTGRVPYGNRSRETILKYAKQDAAFLLSKNVKMIIAACGTVSSVAGRIADDIPVFFTGVLKPTATAAAKATRNGRIGVIGTTATINSGSYKKELAKIDKDLFVSEQDCPLFVPLVENGVFSKDDIVVTTIIERYLKRFKEEKVDTIILGCTHYPLLRDAISHVMGSDVTLVDSGRETALFAAEVLKEKNLLNNGNASGHTEFYVSDHTDGFSRIAGIFLDKDINRCVTRIDIEQY